MKKVLVISTGGTIASRKNENGLAPALGAGTLLSLVPEAAKLCEISINELFSLDSSNITPAHWSALASALAEEYAFYDGFVITHGTDTLAYTSAALSVMLEGIGKPAVITGSQLPAENPDSDARRNLMSAFSVAASGRPGVFVVFGDNVIDGMCAHKRDTKSFNAFESVNCPYKASLCSSGIVWADGATASDTVFSPKTSLDERVLLIKLIPGISENVLDFTVSHGYRGLVIEGFGAGGVPTAERSLLPAVGRAVAAGLTVVCATQCLSGGVRMDEYETGVSVARLGVISAGPMTPEAAVAALMWSLANAGEDTASNLFKKVRDKLRTA